MDLDSTQNISNLRKAEIDTASQIQSVKATASLFSDGTYSSEKPGVKSSSTKPFLIEMKIAKETELKLAREELNKLKGKLSQAEETRARATTELDQAKKTIEDLTNKLNTIKDSRDLALQTNKAAQFQSKQLEKLPSTNYGGRDEERGLDSVREEYVVAITELDAAKEELKRIRQDFETCYSAKAAVFEKESEAKKLLEANKEKARNLLEEIAATRESAVHEKHSLEEAELDELKILSGKNQTKQAYRQALKEVEDKILSLKKDYDPELFIHLEAQLSEKSNEVAAVRNEMKLARDSDLESVSKVTKELDDAKEVLCKLAEEEISLKNLVGSLNAELDTVKKEHEDMKRQDAETQSVAENLHAKLLTFKAELEAAMAMESKANVAHDGLLSTLEQLSGESEKQRKEAEAARETCGELKNEADAAWAALMEAESKLTVTLEDAEATKAAEAVALEQLKALHEEVNLSRTPNSVSGDAIVISVSEYELLSGKSKECERLGEVKVAAALAQVDVVKSSENVALKKIEAARRKLKEIEIATEEALKSAEMAEAAKKVVEEELRRRREREQSKSVEYITSLPLVETKVEKLAPAEVNSKVKTSSKPKKRSLLSSIRGVFFRKKSQVNNGFASYLPGEKPI